MLKAVIFDLDDTLYPELEYVFSGYRAVAAWSAARFKTSQETGHAELIDLFRQGKRHHIFNQWLARYDLDSEENALELLRVYREHKPTIRLFPGVVCLLQELRSQFRLGLVSDGYLNMQTLKLAALGVEPEFDAIVLSDSLGSDAWKPSPRPFQAVLEQLRVLPAEAVYVGDNPTKDFVGARCAGMRSIRCLHLGGLYSEIEPASPEHAPDMSIFSLQDLACALEAMF